MTESQNLAGAVPPPSDDDVEDVEDVPQGAENLPDDIPNDDLTMDEPPDDGLPVTDTDVDAPVEGSPMVDDV